MIVEGGTHKRLDFDTRLVGIVIRATRTSEGIRPKVASRDLLNQMQRSADIQRNKCRSAITSADYVDFTDLETNTEKEKRRNR